MVLSKSWSFAEIGQTTTVFIQNRGRLCVVVSHFSRSALKMYTILFKHDSQKIPQKNPKINSQHKITLIISKTSAKNSAKEDP